MSGKYVTGKLVPFVPDEHSDPFPPQLDNLAVTIRDGTNNNYCFGSAHHTNTVYLYAFVESDGCALWLSIESDLPGDHPLEGERCVDEDAVLGYPDSMEAWMLEQGIAPGQLFLMAWNICYSKHWTDCGYEYDSETNVYVLWVEPWPAERSADAWQLWLTGSCSVVDQKGRKE